MILEDKLITDLFRKICFVIYKDFVSDSKGYVEWLTFITVLILATKFDWQPICNVSWAGFIWLLILLLFLLFTSKKYVKYVQSVLHGMAIKYYKTYQYTSHILFIIGNINLIQGINFDIVHFIWNTSDTKPS